MRIGTGKNSFDLTDIDGAPVDTLDDVLDVAAEVVFEYGPAPGNARIERLARYLALNLGGEPYFAPSVTSTTPRNAVLEFELGHRRVWQVRDRIGVEFCTTMTVDEARTVLVALVRCIERAEGR